jgi:hypothetical protein
VAFGRAIASLVSFGRPAASPTPCKSTSTPSSPPRRLSTNLSFRASPDFFVGTTSLPAAGRESAVVFRGAGLLVGEEILAYIALTLSRDAGISVNQDGSRCSRGSPLTQLLFVLSSELPRVMVIIGKMHDFDFVAFIQRRPELVFAEYRFRFHRLLAFVAECLYRLHAPYATLALRATQAKPNAPQFSKSRPPASPPAQAARASF